MTAFLWTLIVLWILELIAKLVVMAKGRVPERTIGMVAFDTFALMVLLIWAVTILVRGVPA